jgi:hypothetical protein
MTTHDALDTFVGVEGELFGRVLRPSAVVEHNSTPTAQVASILMKDMVDQTCIPAHQLRLIKEIKGRVGR